MTDLHAKYGEYALVTGASSGIGAEFAGQLAAAGLSLVLVARRKDRLDALAGRLRTTHGNATEVIKLDLAGEGAVAELARRTSHLDIGLVVSSAGIVTSGPFLGNELAAESALLRLNLMAPAQLAHVYGQLLARRGRGGLILVSSAVAFAPVPYTANYAAAKAYIASLGQALHYELKGTGIDVLTLAPGPTRTEGAQNAPGIDFAKLPLPPMQPGPVVRAALRALGRKPMVIPGPLNKASDFAGKYLPQARADRHVRHPRQPRPRRKATPQLIPPARLRIAGTDAADSEPMARCPRRRRGSRCGQRNGPPDRSARHSPRPPLPARAAPRGADCPGRPGQPRAHTGRAPRRPRCSCPTQNYRATRSAVWTGCLRRTAASSSAMSRSRGP
jgi:hypothetical protein